MTEPHDRRNFRKEFRDAMPRPCRQLQHHHRGRWRPASGLVVTSAISLSAEPPLLLPASTAPPPAIPAGGIRRFGWSSLGAAHQPVAERISGFAGIQGPARYDGAEWETAVTGARMLKGAPPPSTATVEEMIDRAPTPS